MILVLLLLFLMIVSAIVTIEFANEKKLGNAILFGALALLLLLAFVFIIKKLELVDNGKYRYYVIRVKISAPIPESFVLIDGHPVEVK